MPTKAVGQAQVPLDQIHPNPDQPRKSFDPEAQKALEQSLRQRGLINPISIVHRAEGGYLLIAGERRYRAAQALGWKEIEARIWPGHTPAREIELLAVVENLQRRDLTPIEEAQAYKALQDPPMSMTQRKISALVGRAQPLITLSLLLLDQPPEIQNLINRLIITPAHVRLLAKITDITNRLAWADKTAKEGWSVRELQRQLAAAAVESAPSQEVAPASSDPEIQGVRATADAAEGPLALKADAETSGGPLGSQPEAAGEKFTAPALDGTASPDFMEANATTEGVPEIPKAQDPLANLWQWAAQMAPADSSWRVEFEGRGHWKIHLALPQASEVENRATLAQWLKSFSDRLRPEVLPGTVTGPEAPKILEANYGNGHRLHLRWTPCGEGVTYRIYRAPEDQSEFTRLGDKDLKSTGASVDCWADCYQWFRLAVMAVDPAGRESALSETVRFEVNGLNQVNSVEPL